MGSALLAGLQVLDLSQYIPGPYAARLMAEQGAKVLKIEPPGGDPMRQLATQSELISPVYQALNRDKEIKELDLKSTAGQANLREILGRMDVLIEGFRPGVMARLGFSDEVLGDLSPGLIICHISGYGQTGEDAMRAGHDLGYAARAGLYSQYGRGRPAIVFPPVADHAAALQALSMINAALYQREKTGQGAILDISICEVVCDWRYAFESSSLRGQLSGALACYNIYQCSDGLYIALAALEAKFWMAFCEAIGRNDWVSRQSEAMPQKSLIQSLDDLFKTRTQTHWQQALSEVDCCFEVIPDI